MIKNPNHMPYSQQYPLNRYLINNVEGILNGGSLIGFQPLYEVINRPLSLHKAVVVKLSLVNHD